MKKYVLLFCLSISATFMFGQIYTLPYSQDFEGTTFLPMDWEAFGSNTNAAWQHSTTIGAFGNSSGSAYFDNFTNNVFGNFYGMRAVRLNLTGTTNPTLTFDVAYARRNSTNSDRLGIWYSFNGTTGWMNLINYENNTLTTSPDQTTYFTPTNTQWDSITINLSQFAGTSLIRFAFENNSKNGNVMYIDNVHFYDNTSTGINTHNRKPFNIYPNPSSGIIYINPNEKDTEIKTIKVYSSIGHLIKEIDFSPIKQGYSIDTGILHKGIYFLTLITADSHNSTYKLFIE